MWDEKAPLHLRSQIYDVAAFKAGRTALRPHEIVDLGDVSGIGTPSSSVARSVSYVRPDRAGRSTRVRRAQTNGRDLIHLQCHIGLDTLSWARLGAKVVGLDFSSASIAAARAPG
jgi:hypothetical protein